MLPGDDLEADAFRSWVGDRFPDKLRNVAKESLSDVLVARLVREMEGYYALDLPEQALERAERLLAAGCAEIEALKLRAQVLQDEKRYAEAIETYEALRRRDPSIRAAYIGLGWCHKRTDRLDLALEALERVVREHPDYALGVYNLACYLALDGKRERSLCLLAKAIGLEASFRMHARTESDFDLIRGDSEFQRLISE
jgi:tetratricopeptide (TPR) repeat protein